MPHLNSLVKPSLMVAAWCTLGVYRAPVLQAQEVKYVPLKAANLPAPVGRKVDYVADIHPILRTSCAGCHLSGNKKGGLQLDTRDAILKGGASGPAAVV